MVSPAISFIMPAYNAAEWIGEAIRSVQEQTLTDWELVVVDDNSSDKTPDIVGSLAFSDPRIRLIRRNTPSGSAYMPRKEAAQAARSPLVAPIDADDVLPPEYAFELLRVLRNNNVKAVYPTMYFRLNGRDTRHVPADDTLYGRILTAEEILPLTFMGWKVNCNGGIIDRTLYLAACEETEALAPTDTEKANFDELHTRVLLSQSGGVELLTVPYFYRVNPASITRRISPKKFDFTSVNSLLAKWSLQRFGRQHEIHILALKQRFYSYFEGLGLLKELKGDSRIKENIKTRLRKMRKEPDFIPPQEYVSRKYRALLYLPFGMQQVIIEMDGIVRKSNVLNQLRYRIRKLRESLAVRHGRYLPDTEENSFLTRTYHSLKDKKGDSLKRISPHIMLPEGSIICLCDGKMHHGGPTDRLRGILTTWREARKQKRPFYISWTSPFRLEDYLVPAGIDWRIDPSQLSADRTEAFPLVIQDQTRLNNAIRLRAGMRLQVAQLHVYSNSDNARGEYGALFAELFQPSEPLRKATAPHLTALGDKFFGVSTRFLQLLGDFKDWIAEPLPRDEADRLMRRVGDKLREIIKVLPEGYRLLLTSDSRRFLDYAVSIDSRIYVTPGEIRNVDLTREDHPEAWMKTFVDQQLLMHAERVYLLRTGDMYASGFPRFAAEVGGANFIDLSF